VATIFAVWLPVFVMASHAWRYGDYYDYGWYVPLLAVLMFLRKWRTMPKDDRGVVGSDGSWWVIAAWMVPIWTGCRILNIADPLWRLPQWTAAAIAIIASHHLLVRRLGSGASRPFFAVAAFALTAVPMPSVIESTVIQYLTDGVIEVAAELFRMFGRPVQVMGQRMESLGEWVEVADGCSGIRSLQGFLMVALFFGEWFDLGRIERFLMILFCLISVWFTNVMRALALAWLRFEHGEAIFNQWHDSLSLVTFGVTAAMAWYFASRLESGKTHARLTSSNSVHVESLSKPTRPMVWVGLLLLVGMELVAWAWMNPQSTGDSVTMEMHHPSVGPEFRLNLPEYRKAKISLRCNDGWIASIGEDFGARKMRAGWFVWDSTDGSSVLDVYHHSPEKCMGSIGWKLVSAGKFRIHEGPNFRLGFSATEFKDPALDTTVYVYKTVWFSNPHRPAGIDDLSAADALRRLRLSMAWHRFRPQHARVLMGVVAGEQREEDAWRRFRVSLLDGLHMRFSPPGSPS